MRLMTQLALVGALSCSACVNLPMPRTGYLDGYEQLAPAPERTVRFIPDAIDFFEAPGVDWARYRSVLVEPAGFVLMDPEDDALSEEDRDWLAARFTRVLRERLGEDLALVSEPGDDTLRVRGAITGVNHQRTWLNILGLILVVPPDMGAVSGELEVLDASTGQRLMAMTATREGTPFLILEAFHTYGHAVHSMKKWARELAEVIRPPT